MFAAPFAINAAVKSGISFIDTFDPSNKGTTVVLTNGNLTMHSTAADMARTVHARTTGKWYAEFTITLLTNVGPSIAYPDIGIVSPATTVNTTYVGGSGSGTQESWGYWLDPAGSHKIHNNAASAYGTALLLNDVISVVWDAGAGTLIFWHNGVSQGTAFTGVDGSQARSIGCGPLSSGGAIIQVTANYGATAFVYTPPAGYTAWNG